MGHEAGSTARFGGQLSRGTALLESDRLVFRGDFRLAIPFRSMRSVEALRGELRIGFPGGTLRLTLGPAAAQWAQKILHPKSLLDKLGVKAGSTVSVLGVRDVDFRRDLATRTSDVADRRPRKNSDLIFFAANSVADLARLTELAGVLKKTGALWVIYPKGRPEIAQSAVLAASRQAGLVDVKVVSFSPLHTALKMVIPVARR